MKMAFTSNIYNKVFQVLYIFRPCFVLRQNLLSKIDTALHSKISKNQIFSSWSRSICHIHSCSTPTPTTTSNSTNTSWTSTSSNTSSSTNSPASKSIVSSSRHISNITDSDNCLRKCWKCGNAIPDIDNSTLEEKDLAAIFYCLDCGALQPPANLTYFQLFGLHNLYDIDTKRLTKTYRAIQQKLHPDKSSHLSEVERAYSDDQSALVNKAYDTLLKPVPRAIYLLSLHGQTLEEDLIPLDAAFLTDIMEVNEEIASTNDHEILKSIYSDNREELDQLIIDISGAFAIKDIYKAKMLISKVKYLVNIEDKIKEKVHFI